ncbi:MAG: zinc ribbon domain-containing protein [Nitrososphaerota archaeon]
MRKIQLLMMFTILAALQLPVIAQREPDARLSIEVQGVECVAGISASLSGRLTLEGGGDLYRVVENLTSGDILSLVVAIADLRSCTVEDVEVAAGGKTLKPQWLVYGGKLYANIPVSVGENHVRVVIGYTPPKTVYVEIKATNPGCLMNITANAPVKASDGGWVAGPWREGDTAEISATPSEGCYIAGWMRGDEALTTYQQYSFTAGENMTLTVSAERRGARPPPSLIDFTILSVRATGPGNVIVSTKPITGEAFGTPQWQASLNPGTTIYIEAQPVGCGEFKGWRGLQKLEAVETPSLTLITEPGFMDVEAIFQEMVPCPYIVIGSYRLMRVEDLPIVVGVVSAGGASIAAYRLARSSNRRRRAMDELMPRWSEEVLTTLSTWEKGAYGTIARLVRDNKPPETPAGYRYIIRVLRDGIVSDIMVELEGCRTLPETLFKIDQYKMLRIETASRQGYWAERLLTAYLAFRGYAPLTTEILYKWVGMMTTTSSAEDARNNVEMLWTDKTLVRMQERAVEKVREELAEEGLEHLLDQPPKPLARAVEQLISEIEAGRCPSCGRHVGGDEVYCIKCGALLKRERAAPAQKQVQQPKAEVRGVVECPSCGRETPSGGRYCIRCGAVLKTAQLTAREEGRTLRELVERRRAEEKPAVDERVEGRRLRELVERFRQRAGELAPTPEPTKTERVEAVKPEKVSEEPVQEEKRPQPELPPEKPEPMEATRQRPIEEARPEVRAGKASWELPKWILDELEGLGVRPEEVVKAVESTPGLDDVDKAAYRAASTIAKNVELATDNERAALITQLASILPYAINEYRAALTQKQEAEEQVVGERLKPPVEDRGPGQAEAPQSLEQEVEGVRREPPQRAKGEDAVDVSMSGEDIEAPAQPPQPQQTAGEQETEAESITLKGLTEMWRRPGTAYLLDDSVILAAGLPTGVVSRLFRGRGRVIDMEKMKTPPEALVRYLEGGPALLILTRGRYPRRRIKTVEPEEGYKPLRLLRDVVGRVDPKKLCLLTHPAIFDTLPEEVRRGFKVVRVTLDVAKAREVLAERFADEAADKLAVAQALIPELAEMLASGEEELAKFLKDFMAEDDAEYVTAIAAHAAFGHGGLEDIPKALLLSLGIVDEP